jgi:hypothetical protein
MTAEQRRRAAAALWGAEEAAAEKAQATQLIAKQLKFRPKSVSALDAERKARYLASVPDVPDEIASRLLVLYHLTEQRPMMGTFLDALGIAHDNGMIQDDAVAPDQAKIPDAVGAIARAYPAEDVSLYLSTLRLQDPAAWAALETAPEANAP